MNISVFKEAKAKQKKPQVRIFISLCMLAEFNNEKEKTGKRINQLNFTQNFIYYAMQYVEKKTSKYINS